MDRTQILAIIDGLSKHLEGIETKVSERLKSAFEYCVGREEGRKARLIKGDLSGIQAFTSFICTPSSSPRRY